MGGARRRLARLGVANPPGPISVSDPTRDTDGCPCVAAAAQPVAAATIALAAAALALAAATVAHLAAAQPAAAIALAAAAGAALSQASLRDAD